MFGSSQSKSARYRVQLWKVAGRAKPDVQVDLDVESRRRPSARELAQEVMLMRDFNFVEVAVVSVLRGEGQGTQQTVRRVSR